MLIKRLFCICAVSVMLSSCVGNSSQGASSIATSTDSSATSAPILQGNSADTSANSSSSLSPSRLPITSSSASSVAASDIDSSIASGNSLGKQPDWAKIWLLRIELSKTKYSYFSLVYIDDDNIPELYMYSKTDGEIYSMQGTTGIYKAFSGEGGCLYVKNSGKLMHVIQQENLYTMRIYELNGYFREVLCAQEYKDGDKSVYYINNSLTSVDEAEVKNTVNSYIDTSKAVAANEKIYTYDEISSVLKSWRE